LKVQTFYPCCFLAIRAVWRQWSITIVSWQMRQTILIKEHYCFIISKTRFIWNFVKDINYHWNNSAKMIHIFICLHLYLTTHAY
jgi:hypothetical protein